MDETALRDLFNSLSPDEPYVIDMTNFEGMGTLLYPAFVEFALRNPRTSWAASTSALSHLQAMRITNSSVFQTVEEARHSLENR
jgi:hypothetical protein